MTPDLIRMAQAQHMIKEHY